MWHWLRGCCGAWIHPHSCQPLPIHHPIRPPMPVNTAALKTFAPAMRRQLLEAVGRKLDLLLHQASADLSLCYTPDLAD